MVLVNSYTTGLSPAVMQYILGAVVNPRFGGAVSSDEIWPFRPLPPRWRCPAEQRQSGAGLRAGND